MRAGLRTAQAIAAHTIVGRPQERQGQILSTILAVPLHALSLYRCDTAAAAATPDAYRLVHPPFNAREEERRLFQL